MAKKKNKWNFTILIENLVKKWKKLRKKQWFKKSFLQASKKGGGVTIKKKHKNEQETKRETTIEQI